MGHERKDHWKCDRCKKQEDTDLGPDQKKAPPLNWREIKEGIPGAFISPHSLLCPECAAVHKKFMDGEAIDPLVKEGKILVKPAGDYIAADGMAWG